MVSPRRDDEIDAVQDMAHAVEGVQAAGVDQRGLVH